MKLNKIDFIVGYGEKWKTPLKTSKHHIIKRLLNDGHRVLYVETPINFFSILKHPREFLFHHLKLLFRGPVEIEKNLWIVSGFFLFPYHPGFNGICDKLFINTINQKIFSYKLKYCLNKLEFKDVFFVSYYPFLFPVIKEFNFKKIIFHIVDEWQGMSGIPKSMKTITDNLVSKADITVVTSSLLKRKYVKLSNNVHLINHGTDFKLFSSVLSNKIKPLNNFNKINGDVNIGYYGALHKLDFKLVEKISKNFPNFSFIFLGPLEGPQGFKLDRSLPNNVLFWDSIPREKLPFFLKGIDIFWMPFKVNDLTKYMSPIKIFEVLSAGIPILSSDLEGCRQIKSKLLFFANSTNDHSNQLKNIIKNLSNFDSHVTSSKMKKYDWDERYKQFINLLSKSK